MLWSGSGGLGVVGAARPPQGLSEAVPAAHVLRKATHLGFHRNPQGRVELAAEVALLKLGMVSGYQRVGLVEGGFYAGLVIGQRAVQIKKDRFYRHGSFVQNLCAYTCRRLYTHTC